MATPETILPRTSFEQRHRAAFEATFASQRARMLEAMVELVREKGYRSTTVADVVKRARTSRRAFYEHFDDRDDCFVAAFETGAQFLFGRVASELEAVAEDDWLAQIETLLTTYLGTLAAEPGFAYLTHVAVLAASDDTVARRTAAHDGFVELYRRFHQLARAENLSTPALSDEALEVLIGGIAEYVRLEILRGKTEGLPDHGPALIAFAQSVIGRPGPP